jgi:hypothetical protein
MKLSYATLKWSIVISIPPSLGMSGREPRANRAREGTSGAGAGGSGVEGSPKGGENLPETYLTRRGNILLVPWEGLATCAGGNGPSRCAEGTNANGDLQNWPRALGIGARGKFLVHSNLGALVGALLEYLAIGLRYGLCWSCSQTEPILF